MCNSSNSTHTHTHTGGQIPFPGLSATHIHMSVCTSQRTQTRPPLTPAPHTLASCSHLSAHSPPSYSPKSFCQGGAQMFGMFVLRPLGSSRNLGWMAGRSNRSCDVANIVRHVVLYFHIRWSHMGIFSRIDRLISVKVVFLIT